MTRTRLSLFYLAGYLTVAGVGLLFAPRFSLRLFLSNGDYGDVFPRLVGMLLAGLAVLVVQLIRLRLYVLYPTTLLIRLFFCLCLLVFYFMSKDPLFLVLLGVVGLGVVLTASSYWLERGDTAETAG